MSHRFSPLFFFILGAVTLAGQAPSGERPLFDGKTTAGWRGFKKPAFPDKGWVVENGWLKHVAKGATSDGGGDIITIDTFDNFDLQFDWRIAPGGNSGVKYQSSSTDCTWSIG